MILLYAIITIFPAGGQNNLTHPELAGVDWAVVKQCVGKRVLFRKDPGFLSKKPAVTV